MNNLSVLRGPYIQNLDYKIMVERNIICPTCRNEQLFFNDSKVSWEDLRGLSWLFCENCSNGAVDENIKPMLSCA